MNDNGMKSCPHCGANIDAKYDVCPICGYVLNIDYANYKCNYQNPQGVQPPDATNDMAVGCLCCGIGSLIFLLEYYRLNCRNCRTDICT